MMPTVQELMRRLSETPQAFLGEPCLETGKGEVAVHAVVGDVLRDYGLSPAAEDLAPFDRPNIGDRNYLRLVLVACWMLRDPKLVGTNVGPRILRWLESLRDPTRLVLADAFVTDQERREELVRRMFAAAKILPPGETEEEAGYRLSAVDCVHRHEVMQRTVEARKRAEELRRKMEEERAREAAARYTRE